VYVRCRELLGAQFEVMEEEAEARTSLGTARRARADALKAMGGPVTHIENMAEVVVKDDGGAEDDGEDGAEE
jgi:hypothetical protein